ncbi:MAG: DUF885 domain-containing protein [Pseudomonadota bacterium]
MTRNPPLAQGPRRLSAAVGLALFLAACNEPAEQAAQSVDEQHAAARQALDALIARQTTALLATLPETASYVGVPEALAGGPYNSRLNDYRPAAEAERRALMRRFIAELDGDVAQPLDEEARLSRDIVRTLYANAMASGDIAYGLVEPFSFAGHTPFVVSQISGPHIGIANLMQAQQPVTSEAEARDYIARLAAIGPTFDGVIEKLNADAALGLALPKALMGKMLGVLDGVLATPPEANALITSFKEKLEAIPSLDAPKRAALGGEALNAMRDVVLPAYQRLRDAAAGLEDKARQEAGIWAQPQGEAFYAAAIRNLGDSDLNAEQIHAIGLAEVARIGDQMDAILKSQGYGEGSVGERMMALGEDPRFRYPNDDAGRARILADLRAYVAGMEARLPDYFIHIPPQALEIRRVPEFTEATSPGGYYDSPSLDGTRPGIYWINLADTARWPAYSLKTLTYHEGVPGHHFQNALSLGLKDIPLARQIAPFNAYGEGWALYAERLAAEMGLYADDPFGDLGRLQDELFRAVRLVVDTGLHAKRWTREEAIAYMRETTGASLVEVTPEIERYMAWPGQALGYKLGQLKILELRDMARDALAARFDIRAFHDQVLMSGPLPMAVLEAKITDWIAAGGPATD